MIIKTTRKLSQTGPSSLSIVLPKPIVDAYGLRPKEEVLVLYDEFILIVPASAEKKLKEKETLVQEVLS